MSIERTTRCEYVSDSKYRRLLRPLVSKLIRLQGKVLSLPKFTRFDHSLFLGNNRSNYEYNCPSKKPCIIGGGRSITVDPPHIKSSHLSANERLHALSPYIDKELFNEHGEFFAIFRGIVTTLISFQDHRASFLLKAFSARSYGADMALKTRSSYYSLNRKALFENDQQSSNDFGEDFFEDLDDWLGKTRLYSPSTCPFRNDMVTGYLIRLISMNASPLLHPLIPILLHWLREEYDRSHDARYVSIQCLLMSEFCRSHMQPARLRESSEMFWTFYISGYYRGLFYQLSPDSPVSCVEARYNAIMLEIFSKGDYLRFPIMEEISLMHGYEPRYLLKQVYRSICLDHANPMNNRLLAIILSQIMERVSENNGKSAAANQIQFLFIEFLQYWLSFLQDRPLVYNSLYPGNEHIFRGCITLAECLKRQASKRSDHGDKILSKNLLQIRSLTEVLYLFKAYFLDLQYLPKYLAKNSREIVRAILLVQGIDLISEDVYENSELLDFLSWLESTDTSEVRSLAEILLNTLYDQ